LGFDAWLTALLHKINIVIRFEEVKTGCSMAEIFNGSYGLKRVVLPMMMISMTFYVDLGTMYQLQSWSPNMKTEL
jgi:hypothetical protein